MPSMAHKYPNRKAGAGCGHHHGLPGIIKTPGTGQGLPCTRLHNRYARRMGYQGNASRVLFPDGPLPPTMRHAATARPGRKQARPGHPAPAAVFGHGQPAAYQAAPGIWLRPPARQAFFWCYSLPPKPGNHKHGQQVQNKEKRGKNFISRKILLLSPLCPRNVPKMSPNYLIAKNSVFISISRQ